MSLHLYDNYERRRREFTPLNDTEVGLYTCGPTVYDFQHIGNLRTYLFEDLLKRVLTANGYRVKHVMNITDVGHLTSDADTGEDKMEKGSRRTGRSAWDIAAEYTQVFRDDLKALNIAEPDIWCKATDHIAEQIAFIADIEKKGFTYQTSDGVYFDTSKQPDYGYLARLDKQRIIELMPDNRIRPLIHRTFAWRPDGPIKRYFRSRLEAEYLSSTFHRSDEAFLFVNGMLSGKSTTELIGRMRKLAAEFAEMHRDDLALPLPQRHGTSVLLAIRPWEPRD